MRLKQLLGVALLLMCCVALNAATSQLTDINVAGKGNVATVTLHASGAFTHNEYRPTDNLLLVDLAGVTPSHFGGVMKDVHVPGVASYHVLNYKGAAGTEVTRVELALLPGAMVKIGDVAGGVSVQVTASAATPSSETAKPAPAAEPAEPAAAPAKAEPKPAAPAASGRVVTVQHIAVARAKDGVDVEISGTGVLTPKAMRLSGPDRIVIDLINAVPARNTLPIAVNTADVKTVRMARYQMNPPVTRVVVDLASSREYDLLPSGHKLTLKLHGAAVGANAAPATPQQPVVLAKNTPPAAVVPPPAPAPIIAKAAEPARDLVVVEPTRQPKGGATAESTAAPTPLAPAAAPVAVAPVAAAPAPVVAPPASAVLAAARFAHEEVPAFSTYGTSAGMSPATMNAAMRQAATQPQAATSPAAARGPRYTGEPISVNLKDVDLKDFFRLIHEISGLNIVLDPNVRGSLTLVLDDVPWDQALDIVLQNNGLDKQIEGNVLRIATIDALRKEAEAAAARDKAQALAVTPARYTHYLSYAKAADAVPTVKKFLTERGDVIADNRTNSLIIQDIPTVIPKIQQLLVQLDQKTPQVEIEARVVLANRSFARDIGTQLGFGTGGKTWATGGAGSVGTSPLLANGLTPNYITLGNAIPLFTNMPSADKNAGLSFLNATNNYRIDVILTAAETRGLVRILSRPRITTQNNQQATVRQGVQLPIVTAAQLGGPPTVTYVPAFLRLSVTPQITAEGTIFMQVDLENTAADLGNAVQGNPALLTQQATTQVLVTDGGTAVIAGVIQTQNSINVTQVPLLGSIPFVGNLFKHRSVSTKSQELIFFITPKIIQS